MNSLPPSPPFVSRLWPTLVLVVAALGVPATTIALFTRFVTEHPLLALSIGLLYEVALFILGFVGEVWGKLEGPLVERTATRLDHLAQSILSHYRKQYYDYLCYQHRDFDVKGLSILGTYTLELDQVFVELRVDPSTPQQASVNPVQIPQPLREGSHAIWDYLTSPPLRQQHFVVIGPHVSGLWRKHERWDAGPAPDDRHDRKLPTAPTLFSSPASLCPNHRRRCWRRVDSLGRVAQYDAGFPGTL